MVGMLTIPWTMTAELFPTEIREIAHSISYSIANILMFVAVQSYRNLTEFLGGEFGYLHFVITINRHMKIKIIFLFARRTSPLLYNELVSIMKKKTTHLISPSREKVA